VNTIDFLRLLWPENGTYLVLIPTEWTDKNTGITNKSFKHFAFNTIEDAAHRAVLLSDGTNQHNVFFALATVKEDLTRMSKAMRDEAGKKVRGVHKSGHDNTAAIKAFWLDLDVDPAKAEKGIAYATRDEAATGLRQFCADLGMPKPFVTSSGGGYHVYWPLAAPIDPEVWQAAANTLKQLADTLGLRQDRTRTADRASILRPVGTNNWKTGTPRPVELVVAGEVVPADLFIAHLDRLALEHNVVPLIARSFSYTDTPAITLAGVMPVLNGVNAAATINAGAAAGAGYDLSDPRETVAQCRQLSWQLDNQADVPEPLWYAMLGTLRHAADGRKACHFMSRMSPTYDPVATDLKIQQHIDGGYGPGLCTTFEQHRPGGCDGCPHKGNIKTPLQITRRMTEVSAPTVEVQIVGGTVQVELPKPPYPFKRVVNPHTGQARISMLIGSQATGVEEVVVYEYDLYPSRLIYDERTGRYCVVVNRWLPKDGWTEFEIPTGRMYDRKQFAATLGDIGVMPDPGMIEEVVLYMIGYIRDLQKLAAANVIYAQLGWRPDCAHFVLPNMVVSVGGSEQITPSKNIVRALSWDEPRGDLDSWKAIVATYEKPGMEAHQFGFGVGFASPLFCHTSFNGMIVSLVGKRGAGKSSAAMSANSIWGHPKMGWGDMEHDTLRAFYQKLGVLKNLPATYDEHTNLEGEVVSDLCYMVSKGQGRQRLQANGEAQENHGNFQLMMLMTGNTSLNSRLATAKADSSAEAARVFEYEVPENTLTKEEADENWGPGAGIFKHYGLAGEVYARQMLMSYAWSQDRVRHWVKEIDRIASVTSGERFWSAGVACVLTGFELSNQCGLTNVDIDRLLKFAVNTIADMRGAVTDNTRTPVSVVSDYVNGNLRSTLILASEPVGLTAAQMLHVPTDKLRIRMERHTGNLYIDRADFRRYCASASIDPNSIAKELKRMGVLKSVDLKVTLGKGTVWSGMQSICWRLDMKHPAVIGLGELTAVAPADSNVTPIKAAQ
jgi:hypothetical protein